MCTVCVVYIPIRNQYATNTSLIRYFVDSFFERLVFGPSGGGYSFCAVVRIFPLRTSIFSKIINHLSIVKSLFENMKKTIMFRYVSTDMFCFNSFTVWG